MTAQMAEPPLDLLKKCSNEDLEPLVGYILKASTNMLDLDPTYKKYQPNHLKYVDLIAKEVRTFGGNTFRNVFREGGPPYQVVVRDVARRLKVDPKPAKDAPIEVIELAILKKFLEKAYEGMSEKDKMALIRELGEAEGKRIRYKEGVPLSVLLAQVGVRMTGFVAYRMSVVVANAVAKFVLGRGLAFAANAALTRSVALFAGPIGWILSGMWLAFDLAGPAYRVTIPCIVHIAYLRQKKAHELARGEV